MMDIVCYSKVAEMVRKGHQVMVFVHARNATLKTAQVPFIKFDCIHLIIDYRMTDETVETTVNKLN